MLYFCDSLNEKLILVFLKIRFFSVFIGREILSIGEIIYLVHKLLFTGPQITVDRFTFIIIYTFFLPIYRPGTALLIVTSGLNAVFPAYISLTESFFINIILVIYYVWACFNQKQEKQLQLAQFMTFLYSTVMTITLVGFMVQVSLKF